MYFGRDAEREADYYGMTYMLRAGYDPKAAVDLQQTFVRLSKDKQPNWLEGMFASHPPSPERVELNRKRVVEMKNPGGKIGRAQYQKKIARLRKTKQAYDAYEDAKKAFDDENTAKALTLVNGALRIEPNEALFHSLRGEIRERQGRSGDAAINFDRAIAYNP